MKRIPYLHIVLFIATFLTTLTAGALQKGINIIKEPGRLIEGLPFAATLMSILLCHELAHYIASRKHHTKATLPYFIPAPSIIGTFGAFIKMESPIITRKALIDIGASGPIAGFIISVAACIVGLAMSETIVSEQKEGVGIALGSSVLFTFLSKFVIGSVPDNYDILLHPVAFAGWIGLFITSLNLIPIGQLDGGHIVFAVFGERHRYISIVLVGTLGIFGFLFWEGWLIWAVLMIILGTRHPPILYWEVPLDPKRKLISITAFIIFAITFIPSPFTLLI